MMVRRRGRTYMRVDVHQRGGRFHDAAPHTLHDRAVAPDPVQVNVPVRPAMRPPPRRRASDVPGGHEGRSDEKSPGVARALAHIPGFLRRVQRAPHPRRGHQASSAVACRKRPVSGGESGAVAPTDLRKLGGGGGRGSVRRTARRARGVGDLLTSCLPGCSGATMTSYCESGQRTETENQKTCPIAKVL